MKGDDNMKRLLKKNDTNARILINYFMKEKGYGYGEAKQITQNLFDDYNDNNPGCMTLDQRAKRILSASEYAVENK